MNKGTITQIFGVNKNASFYQACGHTGVDEVHGYGTPVCSLKWGHVYKILDDSRPANDGSGYWGVFIIAEEKDGSFSEWQIGHLSKILCKVGDRVEPWTIIGEEGNKGGVSYNGQVITRAMQEAGDRRGSHRHWNKKKLIQRSAFEHDRLPGPFLTQWGPSWTQYRDKDGFYYEVINGRDSCNGSVDPMKDIDAGYAAVRGRFELEAKVIQNTLEVANQALKYPILFKWVQALIHSATTLLSKWRV